MKPGLRLWRSSQGPGYGAKRSKGQGSRGRFLHKQQLEMGGLLKRLKRLSFAASCAVSCCLDFAWLPLPRASREELRRSRKAEMERLLQRLALGPRPSADGRAEGLFNIRLF